MMMRLRHTPGIEAIAYQPSKVFFNELTVVIQQYKDDEISSRQVGQQIEACIKHHTNITTDVNITTGMQKYQLATLIPNIRNNHPLVYNPVRPAVDAKDIIGHFKKAKTVSLSGSVNRSTHKVGGVFADLVQTIYVGRGFLDDGDIQADELAAGILHEVGHWFSYYETLADVLLVNYVMSELSRNIVHEADATLKMQLYLEAADMLGTDKGTVRKAVDERGDDKNLPVILLDNIVKNQESNSGVRIYDIAANEQLADQFISRLGAGTAIARFLAKFHSKFDATYALPKPMWYLLQLFTNFAQVFYSPIVIPILLLVSGSPLHQRYDPLPERLARLRLDLVAQIRSGKYAKEVEKRLLAEVDEIKQLEKQFSRTTTSFYEAIWKYLIPSGRKDRKDKDVFKDLENLANNNLFVRAAQFAHQ